MNTVVMQDNSRSAHERPRSALGDLLVSQGKLSARDLDRAINARDETGAVLEQALVVADTGLAGQLARSV